MKGFVWKRVNRLISLGVAHALALCTAFLLFIMYSAYTDLIKRETDTWEWVMLVPIGLTLGLMALFLLFCTLTSLFEGITGWRLAHPFMRRLMFNSNAHLARGETPCEF